MYIYTYIYDRIEESMQNESNEKSLKILEEYDVGDKNV